MQPLLTSCLCRRGSEKHCLLTCNCTGLSSNACLGQSLLDIARPAMWLSCMHTLQSQCWNDISCSPTRNRHQPDVAYLHGTETGLPTALIWQTATQNLPDYTPMWGQHNSPSLNHEPFFIRVCVEWSHWAEEKESCQMQN